MLSLKIRGKTYHVDCISNRDLRSTLGTGNQGAALRLVHKLEIALSEGASSALWPELKQSLPDGTYTRFANHVGVKPQELPTWKDLRTIVEADQDRRIALGKFSEDSKLRYQVTLNEFETFLNEEDITLLRDVNKLLVDKFKVWRVARVKARKQFRGGGGLALDAAILHRAFAVALDNEMILRNPVKMEGRPGENPEHGAEPFTGEELNRLRDHAGQDRLALLVLRWLGLRGSDVVKLTFGEIDFEKREVTRITQKRKKKVILPVQTELLFALEVERDNRKAAPTDRVLLNPETGKLLTRPRLYQRMVALGKRAGVANAHPHRFRDTFAVDMLLRGASPYDAAKMLGDTINTVEKHYMPFIAELRERVRSMLESGAGLEQLAAAQKREAATNPVTPASQVSKRFQ